MILIVSTYEHESSTIDVMNWLLYKKANYQRLNGKDLSKPKLLNVNINDDSTTITLENEDDTIDFNTTKVIWFRRWFDYRYALKDFEVFDDVSLNKDLKKHIFDEYKQLSNGFYYLMDLNTPYWLSKPEFVSPNKLISLMKAKSCGLQIPMTIITNSKEILENVDEPLITKNIGEVKRIEFLDKRFLTYTTEIEKSFISSLTATFCPTKFQKKIDKVCEIRTFILEDELYSMAIFSQLDTQTVTDFRIYNDGKPNRKVPYQLPKSIEEKLLKFMAAMNLNTGSVDLIETESGEYVFLEVNPIGQFGMVSYPCNYHLEEKIADLLIQKDNEK